MTQSVKERLAQGANSVLLIQEGLKKLSSELRANMPGIVKSFDPLTMTASVQPAIRESVKNYDSLVPKWTELPVISDVPVLFPGSSDYIMTFPLQEGDEVLLVFSDMNIDGFWQTGKTANQTILRRHALSDAMAIPVQGISQPKAQTVTDFNTVYPELRSADVTVKLGFTATGFMLTGDLQVSGSITASTADIGGIAMTTHVHSDPQGGTTGGPQ